MKTQYRYVDSGVLGSSPAAVYMDTGIIEINKDIWHKFTPYERAFIVEHEKGHYLLPTEYEKEADTYALVQTLKINKNALRHAVSALIKMNPKDKTRLKAIYSENTLLKQTGKTSYQKINNQKTNNMNKKQNLTDSPFLKAAANGNPLANVTKPKKKRNKKKRADGNDTPITTTTYGKSHKINGFAIGNVYFSMTNILLALILVSTFVLIKKIEK